MDQAAVDKMLTRRLNLQRYTTGLTGEVLAMLTDGDRDMRIKLSDFIEDSTERSRAAFGAQRSSDEGARILLAELKGIIQLQRDTTNAHLASEMKVLIDKELEFTANVLGTEPPSAVGVQSTPISGQTQTAIIAGAFALYATRLISDTTQAMLTAPDTVVRLIRGTRAEKFNDGLLAWRNNRLIRPNVDLIVGGTAANATERVYQRSDVVELVDHVATLDFRVCPRCASAEANGPYPIGTQPRIPLHPNDRCINLPHAQGRNRGPERPFVRDSRPVSQIPKSERSGKIGRTYDSIEDFIESMTDAERTEWIGPARAKIWRDGKVRDVRGFVNQITGDPLTLDQL